ncbi:hypothetical protein [Diaphorobacter ruginosibacter]|nr:hypothetical protein [Diaphorobacter ruginosibacter]
MGVKDGAEGGKLKATRPLFLRLFEPRNKKRKSAQEVRAFGSGV